VDTASPTWTRQVLNESTCSDGETLDFHNFTAATTAAATATCRSAAVAACTTTAHKKDIDIRDSTGHGP
jgi:hypothetical protein